MEEEIFMTMNEDNEKRLLRALENNDKEYEFTTEYVYNLKRKIEKVKEFINNNKDQADWIHCLDREILNILED